MENYATRFLADFIEKNQISIIDISEKLDIPAGKLFPGTRESLTADECLKLCRYLHVRPEEIMKDMKIV